MINKTRYNVSINVEFKKNILIDKSSKDQSAKTDVLDITIIANIAILSTNSTKQIYRILADFACEKGYMGFKIINISILEDNKNFETDVVIIATDGTVIQKKPLLMEHEYSEVK